MVRENGKLERITWDEGTARCCAIASAGLGAGAANAVFVNQHETGSFPAFLDQWLAALRHAGAHRLRRRGAARGAAGEHADVRRLRGPRSTFGAARLIVSIGADFLDGWGASVPQQLAFADARAKLADAPRFVYIGPRRSLTGLNADEWIACKPGSELAIVNALAGQGLASPMRRPPSGVDRRRCSALATELAATKPSLVLVGRRRPRTRSMSRSPSTRSIRPRATSASRSSRPRR